MSFRIKTILLFLGISLVPYILTMLWMGNSYYNEQRKIIIKEMNTQLHLTVERIDQNLDTLKKDMVFIAHSDLMNDIYTNDLDRRIGTMLLAKKKDLNLIGDLYLIGSEGTVIASSDFAKIGTKPVFDPFLEIPVFSSFNHAQIGRLAVDYRIENFGRFFPATAGRQYYVRNQECKTELRSIAFPDSIEVAQSLQARPDLTIILEEEKNYAFALLYKYVWWFLLFLIVGAIFISGAAYYVATTLIRPVIALSNLAKEITRTHDYSHQISIKREDEIGQLADSLNTMIHGMNSALSEITDLNTEIEDTQREVVFTMGSIGESRSKETGNHVKRVAEYSKLLALYYGLDEAEAELLKQASPMHDIGKVAIPDAILNKPGRFNEEERAIMDTHAALGYEMLKHSNRPLLKTASIVAYEHHEKWDGSGYPRGLSGEDIHIYGRITALADVFDALGSNRVYKKAWEDEKIFAFFAEEKGKHFDPRLIEIFFSHLDEFLAIRERLKDEIVD